MGQGCPFKAMSEFQEPTKGPFSLVQLQVNPLNLGQSGTGAQSKGIPRGMEEPVKLGGGVLTTQQRGIRRPLSMPAEASDPTTSSQSLCWGDEVPT